MALAKFPRKVVLDAVDNALVHARSARSAARDHEFKRLREPRHIGLGFYRVMSRTKAFGLSFNTPYEKQCDDRVNRIAEINRMAKASCGSVYLNEQDVKDMLL